MSPFSKIECFHIRLNIPRPAFAPCNLLVTTNIKDTGTAKCENWHLTVAKDPFAIGRAYFSSVPAKLQVSVGQTKGDEVSVKHC